MEWGDDRKESIVALAIFLFSLVLVLFYIAFNPNPFIGFSPESLEDGLEIHYLLDTNAQDLTPSPYQHGELIADIQFVSDPDRGQVAYFDGINDAVHFSDVSQILGKSFSISFWMKPAYSSSDSYGTELTPLSLVGYSGDYDNFIVVQNPDDSIVLKNTRGPTYETVSYTEPFSSLEWIHIIGMFDYAQQSFSYYVDGELVGSSQAIGWNENSKIDLNLGRLGTVSPSYPNNVFYSNYFKGHIDDFRLYDRLLTDQEILSLSEPPSECSDGVDNDGDGTIDLSDEDCLNSQDNSEDVISTEGLQVLYTFESDSAADHSGNENDGTSSSGVTFVTDNEQKSKVARLDGTTGYIGLDSTDVLTNTDFSISLRAKSPYAYDSFPSQQFFLSFAQSGPNWLWLYQNNVKDLTTLYHFVGGEDYVEINHAFAADEWSHYTITYDLSEELLVLYIDGELSGTLSNRPPIALTGDFHIGRFNDKFFEGEIDEFRVYNRVLSESEINSLAYDGIQNVCGNGVIEGDEACDGSNLGQHTCYAQGFDGGALSCSSTCQLVTDQCTHDASLELYYKFDESGLTCSPSNDFITDSSPLAAYSGQYAFGPRCDGIDSVLHTAYDFDGVNDYISPSFPANTFIDSYTITGFFKANATNRTIAQMRGNDDFIIGFWTNNKLNYTSSVLGCNYPNTKNKLGYMFGERENDPNCRRWIFSNEAIMPQRWYHYAAVYNATSKHGLLYLNGELQGTLNTSTLSSAPTTRLYIGGRGGSISSGWGFYNGSMDDFRIYSDALGQAKISSLASFTPSFCGDTICSSDESTNSCAVDCPASTTGSKDTSDSDSPGSTSNGPSSTTSGQTFTPQTNNPSSSTSSQTPDEEATTQELTPEEEEGDIEFSAAAIGVIIFIIILIVLVFVAILIVAFKNNPARTLAELNTTSTR